MSFVVIIGYLLVVFCFIRAGGGSVVDGRSDGRCWGWVWVMYRSGLGW